MNYKINLKKWNKLFEVVLHVTRDCVCDRVKNLLGSGKHTTLTLLVFLNPHLSIKRVNNLF